MSEIFPTRLREGGIAIGTATQWLFNFVFSQITPHAVNNLGWRTFLMFCIFNWSLVVYSWFFIKEVRITAWKFTCQGNENLLTQNSFDMTDQRQVSGRNGARYVSSKI